MMELESSYAAAERICSSSGSSFFRSFDFLASERRRAMHTLYAFARIADDATDDAFSDAVWNCSSWMDWISYCAMPEANALPRHGSGLPGNSRLPEKLDTIRPALIDVLQRFRIPPDMLGHLVQGMDADSRGCEIRTWEDLHGYAFRVASSMGICCTAIWTDGNPVTPEQPLWRSAVDCGVAFQLTNILRDVREDALRGRVYLPLEDLERFGMQRSRWLDCLTTDQPHREGFADAASKVIAVQIERARGLFASGWQLHRMLDADSFRMFSLMWQTYRAILRQIERDPLRILKVRVRLNTARKWRLAADHCFTPRLLQVASATDRDAAWIEPEHASAPKFAGPRPSIAVIGGGLAGMNAALHLARHGCKVTLFEAKSRLGGRAGSFLDPVTDQAIDYCQHVGMKCCSELIRWMVETKTTSSWRVYDTLHFVSRRGKPLAVNAWPLPAPLHLSGLILGWPDLSWMDRMRVATGLSRLIMAKSTPAFEQMPALTWLRKHFQNERTIDRFWGTILVSALGDQIDRIAMGPVRKVLVDGFAATRDAFHLLVPTVPLSKLMDEAPRSVLSSLEVDVRCGCAIQQIQRTHSGTWRIRGDGAVDCDAVVIAVPWHRVNALLCESGLPAELQKKLEKVAKLQASPITGVHTWWDRPWLRQPHAILIDRFCQWVFPGPEDSANQVSRGETYYQVVISGSHDLPRGDHESILKKVQKDLQELFPEAKDARLVRGRIVTDPHSVFSVSPIHVDSRLSSSTLAGEGIMLAGDWVATGWPATMEGALRSGLLAAQSTLSYLGRPALLIR